MPGDKVSGGANCNRCACTYPFRNTNIIHVSGLDKGSDGAPGRIRTYDLKLRRLVLYPTELRAPGSQLTAICRQWVKKIIEC